MAQAAEEERQRRIDENQSNDDGKGIPILMRVVQRQRLNFQSVLGDEVSKYGPYCQLVFKKRKKAYEESIEKVRAVVQARFQGAGVEPYGSYASGIMTPDSDIDLVVCMAGDTSWRSNSEEWMINLAKDLKACGWVSNLKAIDGAMMPVIKLTATCTYVVKKHLVGRDACTAEHVGCPSATVRLSSNS
jgi:predicted nucleotidyltransferase